MEIKRIKCISPYAYMDHTSIPMLPFHVNYNYGFPRSLKQDNQGKTIIIPCRGVQASVARAFWNGCPALRNRFRNAHASS